MFFFVRFLIKGCIFLLLGACFFFHCLKATPTENYHSTDFYVIETLCKEVINDFRVMKFDSSLNISWLQQSSYISDQLVALQEAISNLLENEAEVRIYLIEDYAYLLNLFSSVEKNFRKWQKKYTNKAHNAVGICLQRIVDQSKKNLQKIVASNQEIIALDDFFYMS